MQESAPLLDETNRSLGNEEGRERVHTLVTPPDKDRTLIPAAGILTTVLLTTSVGLTSATTATTATISISIRSWATTWPISARSGATKSKNC
jgi:hypothetical protein